MPLCISSAGRFFSSIRSHAIQCVIRPDPNFRNNHKIFLLNNLFLQFKSLNINYWTDNHYQFLYSQCSCLTSVHVSPLQLWSIYTLYSADSSPMTYSVVVETSKCCLYYEPFGPSYPTWQHEMSRRRPPESFLHQSRIFSDTFTSSSGLREEWALNAVHQT